MGEDEALSAEHCEGCDWSWSAGHLAGAAVAFGLMGMAEAIRLRVTECDPHALPCWTARQGWGASACCEVCGAYTPCTNK
jgi:hypothetical protein